MTARQIELFLIGCCIVAALVLVLTAILPSPAHAQNIPRGLGHDGHGEHWYDQGCCSKQDCEPVEPGAIVMTKDGYMVRYLTSRGQIAEGIIPYGSSAIRQSKDAQEHACAPTTRVICIYLPMNV
jgi:hypothetical protein